ncbi:SLC13 family permease [Rossellomorea aquimaris]|uniref:SLC13 family permease n=1 Tax=Rossellomorea aquimaris TaxID=189382 RepID=UPI001CD6E70F|nr:SLC13 family permease [Rossellomorea aquimaris]MCA1059079.1 SLC13 family permease [Rossellomorea aquimaris]
MIEFYFVSFVVLFMLSCLVLEMGRPEFIIPFTLLLFMITGIVPVKEAIKGFSNEGMLTIGLLFIIAGTIQKSGLVDMLFQRLLEKSFSTKHVLTRILPPISLLSGFINNTPIVIAFTPIIKKWCEENGLSPSKFLIPLSYATILGGTITLIGTSTNLVVHGLLLDKGLEGFTFFELAKVGVPITILGLLYLIFLGPYLLPDRKSNALREVENLRKFTGEVLITKDYPYLHTTIKEAKLRSLKGVFLVSIVRDNQTIAPVSDVTILREGDRLLFSGDITTITELQQTKGLELQSCIGDDFPKKHKLVEAVISHHSPLLHKKINSTNFRSRYDAAVIAVHRQDHRLRTKIGDIIIKPGDILLLVVGQEFNKRIQSNDFYFTSEHSRIVQSIEDVRSGWYAILLLGMMIALVTIGFIPMISAMSIMVMLFIFFKMVSPREIKDFIQWNVLLIISSSFGIGYALTNSGVASFIADVLIKLTAPFGVFAVILSVYLLTNIFTELMTNSAAAVLMFPIVIELASTLKISPTPLAVVVAIAASASFATPIGYQTNLIVYGPGGYRFIDFLKAGLPLNLITMVITTMLIYMFWI